MSAIQQNLKGKNAKYASDFTQGDLALPPAKKYVVGEYDSGSCTSSANNRQ